MASLATLVGRWAKQPPALALDDFPRIGEQAWRLPAYGVHGSEEGWTLDLPVESQQLGSETSQERRDIVHVIGQGEAKARFSGFVADPD